MVKSCDVAPRVSPPVGLIITPAPVEAEIVPLLTTAPGLKLDPRYIVPFVAAIVPLFVKVHEG